jgi:hypothetical protein
MKARLRDARSSLASSWLRPVSGLPGKARSGQTGAAAHGLATAWQGAAGQGEGAPTMANGVTIDRESWEQGFDDGARRLPARCPPDGDSFSYLTGYLDGRYGPLERRSETSETLPPSVTPQQSETPAPAAPRAPAAAPRPWWRRLVGVG